MLMLPSMPVLSEQMITAPGIACLSSYHYPPVLLTVPDPPTNGCFAANADVTCRTHPRLNHCSRTRPHLHIRTHITHTQHTHTYVEPPTLLTYHENDRPLLPFAYFKLMYHLRFAFLTCIVYISVYCFVILFLSYHCPSLAPSRPSLVWPVL